MFDGNGNWTSDFSAQADRDNGIKILASRFDNIFIADIKESFENCLTKDGQISPIGNFNMGGQRITNLNAGVNDNDAVNMSQFNNAVHKTGNETITGFKTFNGDNRIIALKNSAVTYNTAPSSDTFTDISFRDKNDYEMGVLEHVRYANNTTTIRMVAKGIDGNWSPALGVGKKADGTTYTSAPASDENDSIVTTVNKSKGNNGYFKLGNGLIIQWGRSSQRTFTYPIPFSSDTSFSIVVNNQSGEDGYGRPDSVENLTRTSCMVGSLSGYPVRWLAIGY